MAECSVLGFLESCSRACLMSASARYGYVVNSLNLRSSSIPKRIGHEIRSADSILTGRRMAHKADSVLAEMSAAEVQKCQNIQENILHDRVVENSLASLTLMESDLHLDHIGQVRVTLSDNSLTWQSKTAEDKLDTFSRSCFRLAGLPHEFPLSEIYGVEYSGWGPIRRFVGASPVHRLLKPVTRMHRFAMYTFQRLRSDRNKWLPKTYTFAHPELEVCQRWIASLQSLLKNDLKRPKDLLVIINPYGGKGIASNKWAMVAPLFSRAGIKTKVVTTTRAGYAFDMMYTASDEELKCHDGVIVVGGDGIFNEVLNGLALRRHSPEAIHTPQQISELLTEEDEQHILRNEQHILSDSQPLIDSSVPPTSETVSFERDRLAKCFNTQPLIPWLRFGIIPAGSTDTIVVSTTGTRDPVTAALHIIMGDSMPLDIVRLTAWKDSRENMLPEIRYAASFAGYGFYGDVARESETLRWMGPARYDYAGTIVFMKHKKYEAEVSYLEIPEDSPDLICRVNCPVCAKELVIPEDTSKLKWRTARAHFHSVGAAVMACRNDKAPDGVVTHAHLSDGLLHLILIKQCSRPGYLLQLIQLARRGGDPLGFDFVEHHKTPIFTFVSHGEQSVWNVDGEIFPAHKLCGQVFRGLVNYFARRPEE